MKHRELKEMTPSELDVKLHEDVEALQNLRFQKSLQQLENPFTIKTFEKRDCPDQNSDA